MHSRTFNDQVNEYLNIQNSYLGTTHSSVQNIYIVEAHFLILEEFILRFKMNLIPFVYLW